MIWADSTTHWDGRWYQHPITGYPCTRDECWDYARDINYVDSGEAPELVFVDGDFELA